MVCVLCVSCVSCVFASHSPCNHWALFPSPYLYSQFTQQLNNNSILTKFRGDVVMPLVEIPALQSGPAHIRNRTWSLRAQSLSFSNTSTWREVEFALILGVT